MNTNLRALLFAVSVTAVLAVAFDHVAAEAATPVIRLDTVEVTAHRANFEADGTLKVVRAVAE
jgi:hypothetical protein